MALGIAKHGVCKRVPPRGGKTRANTYTGYLSHLPGKRPSPFAGLLRPLWHPAPLRFSRLPPPPHSSAPLVAHNHSTPHTTAPGPLSLSSARGETPYATRLGG
eukprot:scaffold162353_cov39-Tisochrysis_lutea.AAC.1